jgi:hypothetical protein
LSSCDTASYEQSKSDGQRVLHAFREAVVSVEVEGVETVGSILGTYYVDTLISKGNTLELKRGFKVGESKGFHKHSIPQELQFRLPVQIKSTLRGELEVNGLETYDSLVIDQLFVPKHLKKLLKEKIYKERLAQEIPGRVQFLQYARTIKNLNKDVHESMEKYDWKIKGWKIDSMKQGRSRRIEGRMCSEFTVSLRRPASDAYLMVRQARATLNNDSLWRGWDLKEGFEEVEHIFHLSLDGAWPCRERESINTFALMQNPIDGRIDTVRTVTISETLYEVPSEDK